MGNAKKMFPHPRVYVFCPPMHAYVVRVHRGGYWCAIKTSSDVWGNNFVGIAPPEYIRDVPCAQAPDPTRPPREPRSARRFWGRSGCCSRRNLRNEELLPERRLRLTCARASHAGACHAPAAVRVGQCKARQLSSPATGQLKAVVNGAAACCAVGVKA